MDKSAKQKLIDSIFEMVLVTTNNKKFCKKPRGERMAWVANQLRELGHDTAPIGASWGVLISPELREKLGSPNKTNIDQ